MGLCLGASSGRASELVFTDEAAFVTALGGTVFTIEESGAADDGLTDLLPVVVAPGVHGIPGVHAILWNDVDLRGDASSLSSAIQVPAADLDDRVANGTE
jgi:hypothetical protein